MRRKLLDNTLTLISGLSIVQMLFTIVAEWENFDEKNYTVVSSIIVIMLIVIIICYSIYFRKKLIVDTFEILKILVQNNKLHTLREVIMVANRKYEKKENKNIIEEANFSYLLSNVSNEKMEEVFDVNYIINLKLKKPFWVSKKSASVMRFYAILDGDGGSATTPISISLKKEDEGETIEFEVLPISITATELDHIGACSGLYEICFHLPELWLKKMKKKYIECTISYWVRNNIKFTNQKEEREYNFLILPENFGRYMKKCKINVKVPQRININVSGQCVDAENGAVKEMEFKKNNDLSLKEYNLVANTFKPKMSAVYFVHLTRISV